MVVRKKNLLDAFQAAAPDAARARPVASEGTARKPSARVETAASDTKLSPQWSGGARTPAWRRILRDRVVRVALIAGAVCIAALIWMGRQRSTVDAGETNATPTAAGTLLRAGAGPPSASPASAEDLAKRNLATAQTGSLHDQQFMNPANKYTVRVKTFDNDAAGQASARALYQYFVKENVPVILPIGQGKVCVLYVGHTEKKKEADTLAAYIQRMAGPKSDSKKPAFADAYVVNIDDVVKR